MKKKEKIVESILQTEVVEKKSHPNKVDGCGGVSEVKSEEEKKTKENYMFKTSPL